jgi:hypothetical protein
MLSPQLLRHREALTPANPPVIPVPHGSLRDRGGEERTPHGRPAAQDRPAAPPELGSAACIRLGSDETAHCRFATTSRRPPELSKWADRGCLRKNRYVSELDRHFEVYADNVHYVKSDQNRVEWDLEKVRSSGLAPLGGAQLGCRADTSIETLA